MEYLIKSKQLNIVFRKEEDLKMEDWSYMLHIYKTRNYYVFMRQEVVYINPDMEDAGRLMELAKKILNERYLDRADRWFDEFEETAGHEAMDALFKVWMEWRGEVLKFELHERATLALKQARAKRLYWKVRKNKEIIRELFDIGFGVYSEKAKCDYQQGAENAFMYGYLLGLENGGGAA